MIPPLPSPDLSKLTSYTSLSTFCRRFLREECGSELVEFALTLPILVILSFGLLQVVLFLASYVGATYGSRAAVRYAAVHSSTSPVPCTSQDLAKIVNTYAFTIPTAGIQTAASWTPSNTVGSTVSVKVTLTFPSAIPVSQLRNLSVGTTAAGYVLE